MKKIKILEFRINHYFSYAIGTVHDWCLGYNPALNLANKVLANIKSHIHVRQIYAARSLHDVMILFVEVSDMLASQT